MLGSVHGVVVDFAELSDPGRDPAKQVNEDASGYAETPFGHLAVVCDGMGGHEAGREASQAAVRTIIEHARGSQAELPAGLVLKRAIEQAGRAVYALGGAAPPEHRPGSTCVALLIHPAGAEVAHAGDSRGYLVRRGHLERLTRDHSMVQELVDSGMLSPADALRHPEANKITRALGITPEVSVEVRAEPVPLEPGDVLLLATDGLTDLVSDPEILDVLERRVPSGTAVACQELVQLANSRGGHDNVTALVLAVRELPQSVTRKGTVIDGAPRTGTLLTDKPGTLSDGAPAPTLYDEGSPRPTQPGLTQVDTGDRRTEPGISLAQPSFQPSDVAPNPAASPPSSSRMLLWLGVTLLLTLLASVGTWAVLRVLHRRPDPAEDVVPPPEERTHKRRGHHPRPDSSENPDADPARGTADPPEAGADSGP